MKTGLAALIHPHSVNEFMAMYNKGEPFVVHHQPDELRALRDLSCLSSLEVLLKTWTGVIQAHLPDVRDESSSIDTNSKDALKLFNNGMGLLFNEAQCLSPLLEEWLEEIKSDLGLPSMTYGRNLLYATPDGKGTAPHFDQNINFVLQIHGTKKWMTAINVDVINPTVRHTMGQPVDPELMGYLEGPLPEKMPSKTLSFDLKPGSLLFVPRGCWHSTEAEGDALALNFTFTAPTWIDLFTAAIRSRLSLSPEWRETANGISDPHRREDAQDQLDELLSTLIQDLPHWNATDILEAIEPLET